MLLNLALGLRAGVAATPEGGLGMRPEIRVGITEGDLCGRDHRVLQAAVDYVARLGGGTVYVGPGEWVLRDSIRLASHVTLRGSGPTTVLRKAPGGTSPLAEDGDYGDVRILPRQPEGFEVGDGVTVHSQRGSGFHSTVATVIRKDPDGALLLDDRLNADFMVADGAVVSRACPLIRGTDAEEVQICDLVLDGNREHCPPEDGCRGGGLNLLRVARVHLARVTIRNVNGDGLSFQNCPEVTVEDCVFEDNAGGGCHPGSGSFRPVVRRCTLRRNGGCGLFLCWRVQHGLFEDNLIEDNGQMGISIGHKDTDNLFRRNQVRRNAYSGIYFRDERDYAAGHRCRIEECLIEDNGNAGPHHGQPSAGLRIDGQTHGIVLRHNEIRDLRGDQAKQSYGVLIQAEVGPVELEGNTFQGHPGGDLLDLREKSVGQMLLDYYETMVTPRPLEIRTGEAWERHRQKLRQTLLACAGLWPLPERLPLDVHTTAPLEHEWCTVQRVYYQVWPGVYNDGLLYLPRTFPERPAPAVLCPHGHWEGGNTHPDVQARCLVLARLGYVVFSPVQQHFEDLPIGVSHQTVMIWNNMRALDYLESRPEVDRERLGCTGCSGGGLQTQMLVAVDERIKAASIVGMTCDYREILFPYTAHCGCNHFPNIMRYTDQPEISTLGLPTPVQYLTMDDWTHPFGTTNFPAIQALYAANGVAERVECRYWSTPHLYDRQKRERMVAWMEHWLRGRPLPPEGGPPEPEVRTFPPEQLAQLTLDLPENRGFPGVGEWARARFRYRIRDLSTREAWEPYREEMQAAAVELLGQAFALPRATAAVVLRRSVEGAVAAERLWFPSEGNLQIPALLLEPAEPPEGRKLPVVIWADPRGKEALAALPGPEGPAALAAQGAVVLLPDVRFYGEMRLSNLHGRVPAHLPFSLIPEPEQPDYEGAWTRNALLWGRPLTGQAVTDLRAALDFLASRPEADGTQVRLVASGPLAAAGLFAAVLDGRIQTVELDFQGQSFDNGQLPLIPNVLRYGDVCQWAAALADRSVTLAGLAPDEEGEAQLRAAFAALGRSDRLKIQDRPRR